MKFGVIHIKLFVAILTLCVLASCMTFTSPKALTKDESSMSAAVWATIGTGGFMPNGQISYRSGLSRNRDFGIHLGFPYVGVDLKKQVIFGDPFIMAFDVGFYAHLIDSLSFFPKVLVLTGTDRIWAILELGYATRGPVFGIGAAATIGRQKRIIPEINVDFTLGGTPDLSFGIAFKHTWKRNPR